MWIIFLIVVLYGSDLTHQLALESRFENRFESSANS